MGACSARMLGGGGGGFEVFALVREDCNKYREHQQNHNRGKQGTSGHWACCCCVLCGVFARFLHLRGQEHRENPQTTIANPMAPSSSKWFVVSVLSRFFWCLVLFLLVQVFSFKGEGKLEETTRLYVLIRFYLLSISISSSRSIIRFFNLIQTYDFSYFLLNIY